MLKLIDEYNLNWEIIDGEIKRIEVKQKQKPIIYDKLKQYAIKLLQCKDTPYSICGVFFNFRDKTIIITKEG